jgi:hypothetical protein
MKPLDYETSDETDMPCRIERKAEEFQLFDMKRTLRA